MNARRYFGICLLAATSIATSAEYLNNAHSFRGPVFYTEPSVGIRLCTEKDGRHITAVDLNGEVLWRRDPFVEGRLEPYRYANPRIVWIGASANPPAERGLVGRFAGIAFDSTQFGLLNVATGDFIFLGQD